MKTKRQPKDLRTLCRRCASEMKNVGIKLIEHKKETARCDKCRRLGQEYELK